MILTDWINSRFGAHTIFIIVILKNILRKIMEIGIITVEHQKMTIKARVMSNWRPGRVLDRVKPPNSNTLSTVDGRYKPVRVHESPLVF